MDGYNVVVPIDVTFRDIDAMGHANNAVYLTWCENGRIGYWKAMRGPDADYTEVPFVLARAEIDFRASAHVGERLSMGVRTTRIGQRSFDMQYRLVRDADDLLLAEARSVQVMFDYASRASMPMPADFRAGLVAIDGEPAG